MQREVEVVVGRIGSAGEELVPVPLRDEPDRPATRNVADVLDDEVRSRRVGRHRRRRLVQERPVVVIRVDPEEELVRLDRQAGSRPGHVPPDQHRMDRIADVEELVVERERRVVAPWTDVNRPATTERQLDQEFLLGPDAKLARGDADRLTGRVRRSDRDRNLSDHGRMGRVGDLDDEDAWMHVRARALLVVRRQDGRDWARAVQVAARVGPVRAVAHVNEGPAMAREHRESGVHAPVEEGVVAHELEVLRRSRRSPTGPDANRSVDRRQQSNRSRRCDTDQQSFHENPPLDSPLSGGDSARARESGRLFDELVGLVLRSARRDEGRLQVLLDRLLRDRALGDVLARRELERDVQERVPDDRPQTARARLTLERLVGDLPERVLGEDELDVVVGKEALVLIDERVLRLDEDLDEVLALQLMHRRDDREPADELGDQPVREEILGHHVGQQLGLVRVVPRADVRPEADRVLADPLADDLLEASERAAADEEHVRRVDRQELLVRMLAAALRGYRSDGPFEDLQQRLLDALAGYVARDRRVVRLARDLAHLVDVDDPGLGLLDVEVRGLDQLQEDVFDVLAHVPGLGQRRGVGDRERDVQDPREGLREERLPAPGGPEQQNVRLLELDVAVLRAHLHALVVVVDGHRERALRLFLRDDVVVENGVDVLRARQVLKVERGRGRQLLVDDLVAEIDALVADVDARAGDQLFDLALRLPAEAAEQLLV